MFLPRPTYYFSNTQLSNISYKISSDWLWLRPTFPDACIVGSAATTNIKRTQRISRTHLCREMINDVSCSNDFSVATAETLLVLRRIAHARNGGPEGGGRCK